SIARAMLHDPAVLVLDEPTAGLDVLASRFLRAFVRGERDRGKAVVFSTHYLAEAELPCDRIGLLHQGRLLHEGTPASLRAAAGDAPSLEEAFLRLVAGKELRETLRDRRTLAVMVLFPLVIYPLVSLVTAQVLAARVARVESHIARVAVEGPPALTRDVQRRLQGPDLIVAPPAPAADLSSGRVDAIAQVSAGAPGKPPGVHLFYDQTREESSLARDRVEKALQGQAGPDCAVAYVLTLSGVA